jgi:hypothetical protein
MIKENKVKSEIESGTDRRRILKDIRRRDYNDEVGGI